MNLEHPFLIYGLCKQVGVPLEDNEAWIQPIKAIMVKKDKLGVLRLEEVYDLGNGPLDKDEPRAYQSRFGIPAGAQGEAGQSSTQPSHHHHPKRRTWLVLPLHWRTRYMT